MSVESVTVSRIKAIKIILRVQFQYSQTLTPIAAKGVRQEIGCHLDDWLREQRLNIEAEFHHYAAPRLFFWTPCTALSLCMWLKRSEIGK